MRQRVRLPLCKCGCGKQTKRLDRVFASHACYTASGIRRIRGQQNGRQAYKLYWKMFDEIFERKYGHLDRVTKTRMLVGIGMKRAYRKTYNQKFRVETVRNDLQDR